MSDNEIELKPSGSHPWEYWLFLQSKDSKGKAFRLRSSTSFGFPAADFVLSSNALDTSTLLVEFHFLGLSGISSPLPYYLVEMTNSEECSSWKDFLNVIENITYPIFFEQWLKYRPIFKPDHYFRYLDALSGYRIQQSFEYQWTYAFQKKVPTLKDLALILKKFLGCKGLTIQDQIPVWQKIHDSRMNGHSRLSVNAILGDRYLQTDQKITIKLSCDYAVAKTLLPSEKHALSLRSFMQRYLVAFFFCEFEIHFYPESAEKSFLGKTAIILDGTTQLGQVINKSILVLFFESCTQSPPRGAFI